MTKIILYGDLDDIFTKKILIILEELKLEYIFKNIYMFSHEDNEYTLLYKTGPIVLYDEKILCEPKFIMRYLAKNNNDDIDLYGSSSSDMWLNFECDIMKCLDIFNKHLQNTEFLSGNTYTIADISYIPESYMLLKTGNKQEIKKREYVYNWLKKIIRRESVKNVLNKNLVYIKKDNIEIPEDIKIEEHKDTKREHIEDIEEKHKDTKRDRKEEKHKDTKREHIEDIEEKHKDTKIDRIEEKHKDTKKERIEEKHKDTKKHIEEKEEKHKDTKKRIEEKHKDTKKHIEEKHTKKDRIEEKHKDTKKDRIEEKQNKNNLLLIKNL